MVERSAVVDGLSPLHRAARQGDWPTIAAALAGGADLEQRAERPREDKLLSHEGGTLLHLAAVGGQAEVCARLIGRGAVLEARDASQQTPLHCAARFGDAATVGTLLGEGADPCARDWSGETPLHGAARQGDVRMVAVLLRRGARVIASTRSGATPLHIAATRGDAAVVRLLLPHSDPTLRDQLGRTALDWATAQGYVQCVEVLR